MNRMQNHNLYHIKRHFERKTGTRLVSVGMKQEAALEEAETPRKRLPKAALIAAVVAVFVSLTAFAMSVFSTWAGDSLTITASYYGSGIVWVEVTNQSDKDLKLEPKMNLYHYSTQELVESTGEAPYIDNLTVPANSTEKIRLDLRRTYDVEALENSKNDFYYLQMTNDRFLLGQTWSCMVSFAVSDYVTPWYTLSDESCLEGVLPSLKAYYRNFTPDIFARWPDAFDYQDLVKEELSKVDGRIVRSSNPHYYTYFGDWMESRSISSFDGYNKLMGIDDTEDFEIIRVCVPRVLDDGTFNSHEVIPLFYLYTYAKADIQSPKDYAFVRGNLLSFEEMEQYKIYEDDEYLIYEMHELFYSDLYTYVQDMMLQFDDIYFTDEVWDRIQRFYNHFSDKEVLGSTIYRSMTRKYHNECLTMDKLLEIVKKEENISYEDFVPYRGILYPSVGYRHGIGYSFVIDGYYEVVYRMNVNGTPKDFVLFHNPTGDMIDIRYDDVEEFVKTHNEPLPRCSCANTDEGYHGWTMTMEYILEQGNKISSGYVEDECCYWINCDDADARARIVPIHNNDMYHIEDSWSEEAHRWILWLVHEETGDRCDLETEDAAAFVNAHGGR